MTAMLARGGLMPHFEVRDLDGETVRYADVWQRRNLVLVGLPADASVGAAYRDLLTPHLLDLTAHETSVVFTRDPIRGLDAPAIAIADRWGEIHHVFACDPVAPHTWPAAENLVEWLRYVQTQCPECQGETR
jgi:hypothetical protein